MCFPKYEKDIVETVVLMDKQLFFKLVDFCSVLFWTYRNRQYYSYFKESPIKISIIAYFCS